MDAIVCHKYQPNCLPGGIRATLGEDEVVTTSPHILSDQGKTPPNGNIRTKRSSRE